MGKRVKNKRRYVQVLSAVLYNANVAGFARGSIYAGKSKGVCVPGLNCYSCPGAVASCPLGTLQNAIIAAPNRAGLYVVGTLLLFGVLFGRVVCGFLCPFGLIQEWLHKIPSPKIEKSKTTRRLAYLRYVILVAFVGVLPVLMASPAFCKFICPAGTLTGGLPLVAANVLLRSIIGGLFTWKVAVLAVIVILSVFLYRVFCRFLCPLGAIYGLFSKIAILGVRLNQSACVDCGECVRVCPVDIRKVGDHNCVQCGRCIASCDYAAIQWKNYTKRSNTEETT